MARYKFTAKRIIIIALSVIIFFHTLSLRAIGIDGTHSAQNAIDKMRQGFYDFSESIDILEYGIHKDELRAIFASATKNDPYLFFVGNTLSYYCRSDGIVVSVKPSYNMERDEAERAVKYCRGKVNQIAQFAKRGENELERALLAHDHLCLTFQYDLTLQNDNIYDFFRSGRGTCQGYAWAYMAVLRELEIDARYVASDTVNHIWTLVKIDGEWYHSDVTWDDPPSGEGGDGVSRRHFLCSDQKAQKQGHRDWYSQDGTKCLSAEYDETDFAPLVHTRVWGDADHSYSLTLCDLIIMRKMLDGRTDSHIYTCISCAETDGDRALTRADVEKLRRRLLEAYG
jgi:hypothetical protein